MEQDGRVPTGQALVSDEAATHLHPSGFDPSREKMRVVDGVAYIMPLLESELGKAIKFGQFAFAFYFRPDAWGVGIQFLRGGLAVQIGPTMFAVVHIERFLTASDAAIAMEARRAAATKIDAVHDSAGRSGIAQPLSEDH